MHPDKLGKGEIVAALGGVLLGLCVFLPWYAANPDNPNAVVAGVRGGSVSAWQAHSILRVVFLLAAIAPLVLLYIVLRDHELSWPRGEMTAVIAIIAFGFIGYLGLVDRPGEPPGEISLRWGWFGALLGVLLMMAGGAYRAGSAERPRKPPGVL
jgi:predicted permease